MCQETVLAELDRRKAQLDAEGYVVIEGALVNSTRLDLLARLNRIYDDIRAAGRNVYPGGVGKTERLILNPEFSVLTSQTRVAVVVDQNGLRRDLDAIRAE